MLEEAARNESALLARAMLAFLAYVVIGVFFPLAEHRAQALRWLPWVSLAACPLMHVFMLHGNGSHEA